MVQDEKVVKETLIGMNGHIDNNDSFQNYKLSLHNNNYIE